MKKTVIGLVGLLLILSMALAACGNNNNNESKDTPAVESTKAPEASKEPEPSKEPEASKEPEETAKSIKLSLRHTMTKDSDKKALARLTSAIQDAEAAQPGLKIEAEGMEEQVHRFQRLRAEMSAGNPPDIFVNFGGTDTKDFSSTGNLLELTPILAELGLSDKFVSLGEFTVDGKIYGLPMAGYAEGFFYNKTIFADNGLKVPTTWDELLAVCEALKAKNIIPIAMGGKDPWVINMIANSLWVHSATDGADAITGTVAGTHKWTDADLTEGFKKLDTLSKKGYFPKGTLALAYDEHKNKFVNNEAAMSFDGTWSGGFYSGADTSKIGADNVGFFALPNFGTKGDNQINASYTAGFSFSSKLDADQLVGLKAFIKAFYSEKYQSLANQEEGWLPSMTYPITGAQPFVYEVQAAMKGQVAFPAFDSVVQQKVREAIETGVQEILGGKSTAEKVVAKIQKAQDAANSETK